MTAFFQSFFALFILAISAGMALGSSGAGLLPKDEDQRLRWKGKSIVIAVSRSLSIDQPNIKSGSDVTGAIQRSIDAWQSIAAVTLVTLDSSKQNISGAGPVGDGVSLITIAATPENILFFGKDPYSSSAKTRIFYDRRGFITEADIALNPFQQFSTDGTYGTFDLESTLRHEIGHLLGLRHSHVVGSVMYDSTTKNGVFGSKFESTSLSSDDISALRTLYGSREADDDCCGSIVGKIAGSGRGDREYKVWVQETATGRLVANAVAERNRTFRIDGLSTGTYSVYAAEARRTVGYSVQKLDELVVEKGKTTTLTARYIRRPLDFSLDILGINGVLSDSAISLECGKSYVLYAAGAKINSRRIRFASDSSFLNVEADSVINIQFDTDLTAVSFRLTIDPEAPPGQYNVLAISDDGTYDTRIGAITVSAP